jgi:hypothetical protein
MYSRELVTQIQRELSSAAPGALVLFGGSYWYGEPTADSDLDFYCVAPFWRLLNLKQRLQKVVNRYPQALVHVVLLPRFYFKRGWYYAAGLDNHGQVHQSGVSRSLIIRNALKLSYFYYLRWIANGQILDWSKANKQLRVAQFAINHQNIPPALFAEATLGPGPELTPTNFEPAILAVKTAASGYFGWSWPNNIIYNLHFLRRGKPLFLFKNPDKMVLYKLQQVIDKKENLEESLAQLNKIVFPILVLSHIK